MKRSVFFCVFFYSSICVFLFLHISAVACRKTATRYFTVGPETGYPLSPLSLFIYFSLKYGEAGQDCFVVNLPQSNAPVQNKIKNNNKNDSYYFGKLAWLALPFETASPLVSPFPVFRTGSMLSGLHQMSRRVQ